MSRPVLQSGGRAALQELHSVWSWLVRFFIGKEADKGMLFRVFIYMILIDTAYIYLRPMFYMFVTMGKSPSDIMNPAVTWVPTSIDFSHMLNAWSGLKYTKSIVVSLEISLAASLLQVFFCAVAGYAFGRLTFPFKRTMLLLLLFCFIMPPQLTILPLMLMYTKIGFLNTIWPILLPTLFGHGLKGALFVIIFRQFFLTQPKELEEAAKIDGASVFRVFYKVMLPLAKPAVLVVFLFSFVWHWNDSYFPGMFMPRAEIPPLALGTNQLNSYLTSLSDNPIAGADVLFPEPIRMSAFFLIILPPLLLYLYAQKWFVESVERTGLVE
jgi:multiple sugar transport system permease protein